MYQILTGIQCISITALFIICWIVFMNWKSMLHSYLFLGCIATLLSSIGYLLQFMARSEEAYFTALQLAYFGRVWITLFLFLFVTEYVNVRFPTIVKVAMGLFNVVTYIIVVTTRKTGLFYKGIGFKMEGEFPVFIHTNGIWHDLYNVSLILYIIVGLASLIIAYRREENRRMRGGIMMIAYAIFFESAATIVQLFRLIPLTRIFDLTALGFYFGTVFLFIAIFMYDILDMESIAREYVADELSEGIIAVNFTGEICYYNKPAISLYPRLLSEQKQVIHSLQNAIETGNPISLGNRKFTPEMNKVYKDGRPVFTIYSMVDDTDHYRYLEELTEQKKIADEANMAKSSFLANMSHEIRTPINAILGMDEMILREGQDKEILSYAADIRRAGRTLLSLINDILDFSKIEEGRMEIIPTQYELSSMINDIVNLIRDRAEKKGLKLRVFVDPKIPHILFGDEIRIKQIALNLLTNAVKYTKQGEVRFETGCRKLSDSEIMLSVKISDTGIGMKEEDMEKLFSPFSRIEEKRNRTIEGTGLGMSIVKQLLSLMDSHLEVHSVYGEGSEFFFEIRQKVAKWEPIGEIRLRNEPEEGQRSKYKELFHAPEASILVVDDTEVNLEVVKNLLKKTQIGIDTALSGREAIARSKEKHYDIIFIDHMMPDLDGIETLHRIKEDGKDDTVYIALTANAISGAREMYLTEGFSDYLPKPINSRHLERMIKRYLPSDKVEEVTETKAEEDRDGLPDQIRRIEGLDADQGVLNCGNEESFLSVLEVFKRTASDKADEIERMLAEGDLEGYTVKVHALKSSARIIGASGLSDMALKLEEAGKRKDLETIRKNTGELLEKYRELDASLSSPEEEKKEKKELDKKARDEAFQTIQEIAQSMDFGLMEGVIRSLKEYSLSPSDREAVKKMEGLLMQLDWEGIDKAAGEQRKEQ